jgi:glycosyltransferase involved in cell wall biosynthesis
VTGVLAVAAPQFGARSETFIQRHAYLLCPAATVLIAATNGSQGPATSDPSIPTLVLETGGESLVRRGTRAVQRHFGIRPDARAVRRFLVRHRAEAMLSEFLDFSVQWLGLAAQSGVRFYAHAHGYDISARVTDPVWRERYTALNTADGVITMSRTSRERLVGLGLEPGRIHVIPYGVDVPATLPRRKPRSVVRCLAVGRMVAKKGPILMLDAFRRAAEADSRLRLDYIGDGPLLPAIRQFVRAFALEDRVTLHGSASNTAVLEAARRADIFVQHSLTDPDTGDEEGLPVAILEAMANALPIVSTIHAGIPEAVDDGRTGLLVREGDSIAMAESLLMLAKDFERRTSMGAAAWRRAVELYSWDRERTQLLSIMGLPV